MYTISELKTEEKENIKSFVKWNEGKDKDFLKQWAVDSYAYPLTVEQIENALNAGREIYKIEYMEDVMPSFKSMDNSKDTDKNDVNHGQMVAVIEIIERYEDNSAYIGRFLLSPDYAGNGHGTAVMKAFVKYCFCTLMIDKLRIAAFDFNKVAIRCYEKAGYEVTDSFERQDGWRGIWLERKKINKKLYRFQYRGSLREDISEEAFNEAIAVCKDRVREEIEAEHILTAALYYHEKMLFLYYEADEENYEPERLVAALEPFLEKWPSDKGLRNWAYMYHIYCHDYPIDWEDWKRITVPTQRRGRITRLKTDKLFSYVYYHKELVDEGLLLGDKYQFISLHEDMLFSYFEEPKNLTNIRREPDKMSKVIKEWWAVKPEEHFDCYPGSEWNFLFIPSYFELGAE